MSEVFVVIYYNVDEVSNSEVIGIYRNKEDAVSSLISAAHYGESNGCLTQYKRPSNDYESYSALEALAWETMTIVDDDIYRIEIIYNQ